VNTFCSPWQACVHPKFALLSFGRGTQRELHRWLFFCLGIFVPILPWFFTLKSTCAVLCVVEWLIVCHLAQSSDNAFLDLDDFIPFVPAGFDLFLSVIKDVESRMHYNSWIEGDRRPWCIIGCETCCLEVSSCLVMVILALVINV
jgi:hypothetical protein